MRKACRKIMGKIFGKKPLLFDFKVDRAYYRELKESLKSCSKATGVPLPRKFHRWSDIERFIWKLSPFYPAVRAGNPDYYKKLVFKRY